MKILTVVGARPQFIKAAPLSRAIEECPDLEEVLVHTGQHFDDDMSDVFFRDLCLPRPKYNLNVNGLSHAVMTGTIMIRLEEVVRRERPDWIIVFGDTDSTLAGALVAAQLNLPIAHVEAGLRSYNRSMPEEINRVIVDHLSTLLLCPTETAVRNLEREGVKGALDLGTGTRLRTLGEGGPPPGTCVVEVGDIMFDSLKFFGALADRRPSILESLNLSFKQYVLATIHRAGNTDDGEILESILNELCRLAVEIPVVFPIHPRTRKAIERFLFLTDDMIPRNLMLRSPCSYFEFLSLQRNARAIVTDSGGVQKEAFLLGVPCFTVREETEWVETVKEGWNTLVGAKARGLREAVLGFNPPSAKAALSLFGSGDTADKIVDLLRRPLGANRSP